MTLMESMQRPHPPALLSAIHRQADRMPRAARWGGKDPFRKKGKEKKKQNYSAPSIWLWREVFVLGPADEEGIHSTYCHRQAPEISWLSYGDSCLCTHCIKAQPCASTKCCSWVLWIPSLPPHVTFPLPYRKLLLLFLPDEYWSRWVLSPIPCVCTEICHEESALGWLWAYGGCGKHTGLSR